MWPQLHLGRAEGQGVPSSDLLLPDLVLLGTIDYDQPNVRSRFVRLGFVDENCLGFKAT